MCLFVVFVDHLNEVVLSEIAMTVDYWLFGSFADCSESCVVVGMAGFVDCYSYDLECFGLFVVVWSDRVVPQGFLQVDQLIP